MADSLYRKLTKKKLATLALEGSVLDLGGDTAGGYHETFAGHFSVTRVNLDAKTEPDIVHDLENVPLPIKDADFDVVLLINVIEHVYNKELCSEARRTLRSGGRIIMVAPFLHHVHPSPHDYVRYTKEGLEELLSEAGFSRIVVEEIGTGVFSAAYNLLHRFVPGALAPALMWITVRFDTGLQRTARFFGKKYTGSEYPLGYYAEAIK